VVSVFGEGFLLGFQKCTFLTVPSQGREKDLWHIFLFYRTVVLSSLGFPLITSFNLNHFLRPYSQYGLVGSSGFTL
jgi:hypothetical protein